MKHPDGTPLRNGFTTGAAATAAAVGAWTAQNGAPPPELVELVRTSAQSLSVRDACDGAELLAAELPGGGAATVLSPDAGSLRIRYPWDLLTLNERLVGGLETDEILGIVRDGVTIDGHIRLGRGSVILPGVYIEGNAVFGEDCKIGPNCYIRGNTAFTVQFLFAFIPYYFKNAFFVIQERSDLLVIEKYG